VKLAPKLLWIGLLLYVVSFFLMATGAPSPVDGQTPDGRMPGFLCAFFAFIYPLEEARLALFDHVPPTLGAISFISLLVSGWINPVFVVTVFLDLSEQYERRVSILKIVLVVMMLFTAVFFMTFPVLFLHPREGYFLWLVAMFLALFADSFSGSATRYRARAEHLAKS
jgi:hypothetical protein